MPAGSPAVSASLRVPGCMLVYEFDEGIVSNLNEPVL